MNKLRKQLLEQTTELKIKFVEQTRIYATNEFNKLESYSNMEECQIGNLEFGFAVEMTEGGNWNGNKPVMGFSKVDGKNFYNTSGGGKLDKFLSEIYRAVRKGKELFISNAIDCAIAHYENSITKLAARVAKKGLNEDKLTMKTSSIDLNIETTIDDGNKTVVAHTIIASGVVQRPHYRYLVR